MHAWVRGFRWQQIQQAIHQDPALLEIRDKKGRNWLHICCSVKTEGEPEIANSLRTAKVLLDEGLDINEAAFTQGEWKATALWYSIALGENLPLSEYLLGRGSDPNHCLWAAVNKDNPRAIRLLFEHGAKDPSDNETTLLIAAIQWNKFAAAEEILKLGGNVDTQDSKKNTALHYLLKKKCDPKHIRMLLEYGAQVDIQNEDGITAADIIQRKRKLQIDPRVP